MQTGLVDQFHAEIDRASGIIAGDRHHRRIERIDQIRDRVGIVGQRRDDERIAGVGDQRGLRIAAASEDVGDLVACALEAARLDVLRRHAGVEFERDHARGLVLEQRLRQAFPGGAGKRNAGEYPGRGQQPAGPAHRRCVVTAHQQMFEQMRIDRAAPGIRVRAMQTQRTPEQRQSQQREQPPRAQKMEILQYAAHGACSTTWRLAARRIATGRYAASIDASAPASAASRASDSGQ